MYETLAETVVVHRYNNKTPWVVGLVFPEPAWVQDVHGQWTKRRQNVHFRLHLLVASSHIFEPGF
jgi:hypothetical protein